MQAASKDLKIKVRGVHTPLTSYRIEILGGHALSANDNKIFKIKRVFEDASLRFKDKNIAVVYITEPMMFPTREHLVGNHSMSWFEFLHNLADKVGFPASNILFYSSNVYARDNYLGWCEKHSVVDRMQVYGQSRKFWLKHLIDNSSKYNYIQETKKMTMFVGRPTLLRNLIVQWYINSIANTTFEQDIVSSFFYEDLEIAKDWNLNRDQQIAFNNLPGKVENNNKSVTYPAIYTDQFTNSFMSGLFNFNIDYHENERFQDYNIYLNFKKQHNWWKEDMLSEKLFRSIIYKKPFIRLGMPHSLKRLREWGFKTFDGVLFDESYDDIEDCDERTNNILSQVNKKLTMPFDKLKEQIYSKQVQDILEYNYNLAYEIYDKDEEIIHV